MNRKTVSQAPIYVRDTLNRAGRLAGGGDFDSAVEALYPVICKNPDVPMLYDKLREYELGKLRNQGAGEKFWGNICGAFKVLFIRIVAAADPLKAMAMCEKSLAFCVDNPLILSTLADVAAGADAPWITSTALNVLCKLHPGNAVQMRRLADAMQRNGQGIDALKVHQDLISKATDRKNVDRSGLQAAMVLASIERGNFNDQKSNKKANAADADDAIIQQLLDGTIHDANQAQLLIDRFTVELKRNDSVDMRRKMADAYMVAGKYEDALREYRNVADKLGVLDPVLDKHIEKAYISNLREMVNTLKASPENYDNPEKQIEDLEKNIYDYRWKHTRLRADRFPNDMQLQFDLGELQFEFQMYDDAENTFKAVAENPQKRRGSLVYLGRCALLKNSAEEAANYLTEAVNDMPRMDKYKREALYYLGNALEMVGKNSEAVDYYRQILVSMPGYRDVNQRVKAINDAAASEK
ncbi:MAG: tetratricopeptide repeat protein [Lentisphaeria bacterium]|nr:tetratricopeptide repeat protein [Lentisphaeria bacterium]